MYIVGLLFDASVASAPARLDKQLTNCHIIVGCFFNWMASSRLDEQFTNPLYCLPGMALAVRLSRHR